MRFSLFTRTGDYEDWIPIVQAAEDAGFDSFSIPDSVFYPKQTDSDYPYNETEAIRSYIEHTPFIEPLVAFAWLSAHTKKLRFFPNVMKAASRTPLLYAKQISSLAVVSDNRFILGAGIGPWEEDFRYNGLEWSRRGSLLDEVIECLRGLMSGDFFAYQGRTHTFGPVKINPVPSKPVPIIVGGHSKPALRRAARIGDGWTAVDVDFAALRDIVKELNDLRTEFGTDAKPFDIYVRQSDFRTGRQTVNPLDEYRRMEELGATHYVWVPYNDNSLTVGQKVDVIKRFGDEVICKIG
ncbi:MAG TPA: TIGR03619 family F420-dependent LLM class oxidoreductase [Paraburkholderia sp.]